jgi:uncharacterized protein with ParB-like and HNH nuclease domain/predicted transport protein
VKATETNLLTLLKKSEQFIIPIYQRTYSWTRKECQQLLDDIFRAGENNQVRAHFIGSFVYIEKGLYSATAHSPLMVIDGQQRLTTITLLLEALARRVGNAEPLDNFTADKIRRYYLIDDREEGDDRFKLLLTQTDKETLLAIVQQQPVPAEHSVRIAENLDFFVQAIEGIPEDRLHQLWIGVSKLTAVDIALDRDQDNPQLIFESMNSTGLDLSQADLIRNYVLMGLEPSHQASLYEHHWRPMELGFSQQSYSTNFDGFMRHYLTVKTGDIPKISAVYEAFKSHASQPEVETQGIDALVQDLQAYSRYYCAFALDAEEDTDLAEAFRDLRELRADVVYPLLLELYDDYVNDVLPHDDLVAVVRLIESYIFRRAVCAIPTNSLNKTFSTFGKGLAKDRYLESIQATFLLLPSYRRFPSGDEFTRELRTRDLYNFQRRGYWLRRIENYRRKERVPVDEYTIEHIMPQNENLVAAWQADLGPDWERIHQEKLHTLGNLTLTAYNSEYSDRPFVEKRDLQVGDKQLGLKYSPLRLNEGLGELDVWDEAAIDKRARRLADLAPKIWEEPSLSTESLEHYKPVKAQTSYTIDDHPNLTADSAMRPIFDALSTELKALDPCVTEEFTKLYVAYKAETNFVDVVPRASHLGLTMNLEFHELNDPRAIARDVTEIGTWGNGDVFVAIDSVDNLPYALGLIRQALDKQLGDA